MALSKSRREENWRITILLEIENQHGKVQINAYNDYILFCSRQFLFIFPFFLSPINGYYGDWFD